jgi:conjugative relaxase-like TrwC/TraI family protein
MLGGAGLVHRTGTHRAITERAHTHPAPSGPARKPAGSDAGLVTVAMDVRRAPTRQKSQKFGRGGLLGGLKSRDSISLLSIGKLAADQATYYLDQAEARVDVVASVGDGIEDYYVGGLEARGEWLGRAAAELGLGGPVDGDALRRVLAGLDPRKGVELRDSTGRVRVAGFDLTFSAPKSVSVVFGVGGPDVREAVRRAHDRAVVEAVGYVERSAAAVRRGHGGCRVESASGVVAAAFRHRTSRVGDPQLHTHVLIANLGRGSDGRWSALDGRQLYSHARVASFVYQAVLRGELTRQLGVEWTPVRQGIAEVVGVPADVMREFSLRRAEIEAALKARGTEAARLRRPRWRHGGARTPR